MGIFIVINPSDDDEDCVGTLWQGFHAKKVRKTTNGNLVAMHQARNVELAAVEKKNLNRQF